jgi:hypothetical protein
LDNRKIDPLFYGKQIFINDTFAGYPNLTVGQQLPKIVLDSRGLYYLNSMEFLASATELEVISAKNIVTLIQTTHGKDIHKKNIVTQEL